MSDGSHSNLQGSPIFISELSLGHMDIVDGDFIIKSEYTRRDLSVDGDGEIKKESHICRFRKVTN